MGVIILLIFASLLMAVVFLAAFIWAVRSGQYEDTCTPSMRMLLDDELTRPSPKNAPVSQSVAEPATESKNFKPACAISNLN